ncbi:YceI family protein [Salegentibacter chungangensis]|uniref:YceI family protein n=1 Tax=Salegentibacter chungangensis TaxID=1335724 RepID=A0ABW3NRE2_9FLAO
MKNIFLKTFVIAAFSLGFTSCKNNSNNDAGVEEAKATADATAQAAEYSVDTASSVIDWTGAKPTGEHTGTIKIAEGTFKASDSVIESGNFVIDMKSINVTDLEGDDKKDLEAHLKGTVEGKEGDFFNVNKYPEATFVITGLTEEEGQAIMEGNLTIKEETKNISFPVTIERNENEINITSQPFSIDRTNWKVNYGSKSVFDGLGDKFINDEIELTIDINASKA